jgi:hypothetical protein
MIVLLVDSHINRVGDKISVNIDLSLVDLQNLKRQQQQHTDRPDWSGLDPLDRHIRKLEQSIDQVSQSFSYDHVQSIDCSSILSSEIETGFNEKATNRMSMDRLCVSATLGAGSCSNAHFAVMYSFIYRPEIDRVDHFSHHVHLLFDSSHCR